MERDSCFIQNLDRDSTIEDESLALRALSLQFKRKARALSSLQFKRKYVSESFEEQLRYTVRDLHGQLITNQRFSFQRPQQHNKRHSMT